MTSGDHDGVWLRFISGPDIEALGLQRREIIDAVEDVVAAHGRGETVFEPRMHLVPDNGGAGHFNVLRGHVGRLGEHGISGIKVVGDFVDNYRRDLPSEFGLLTLYDATTGVPVAIVDATFITEARTGAMTAVGARHLARPDAKVLGHAGARGTAFSNVTMIDSLFDLDEIRVTSRRPESREAFAEQVQAATTTPVRVVADVAEAFDGADILVEATRLSEPEPLLHKGLVRAGALVVPYGTISAVAPDLLDVVDTVVVDDWRESRAGRFGALRSHVDAGLLDEHVELGAIVTGQHRGRSSPEERILFWHRGLSVLDVALGWLILQRARDADIGTMLRYH